VRVCSSFLALLLVLLTARPGPVATAAASGLQRNTIRIMLLGTDLRPPRAGWRTDTMILVTIDAGERLASMVSIPRDLYVDIPGHGKTRLNLADNIGQSERYPGGGPALLREMLEQNLGLTFDRYIRVNFQGFADIVDELGGVEVDVRCPTELWVPNMKVPDEYSLFRRFEAGQYHMDGDLTLMYSRCRAHTPAFDRDRRQREVLLALRGRMLELGVPGLLPRLFEFLHTMKAGVQTDLEPDEMVALAQLAMEIPSYNISQRAIDFSVAPEWTAAGGLWVIRPDRKLVKELMAGSMVPPSWQESALARESLRIAVENGTTIEGFGPQIRDLLQAEGFHVVKVGKADRLDYARTMIISYVEDSDTLELLRGSLGVGQDMVRYESNWMSDVAIRVVVSRDAQASCPR
jgi:LCP family protein required for cell wall assembly